MRTMAFEVWSEAYRPSDGLPPQSWQPLHLVTDCRSLYEGSFTSLAQKRVAIDISAIADIVTSQGDVEDLRDYVHWVPTWAMIADHLTKVIPAHELREILDRGRLQITSRQLEKPKEAPEELDYHADMTDALFTLYCDAMKEKD